MRHRPPQSGSPRQGMVLLAVLVVVVIMTLAAYQYSELMTAEYRAAHSYQRAVQARALADSGVHFTAASLADATTFTNVLAGNPFDNPSVFARVVVHADDRPRFQGRFSVIAPLGPDDAVSSDRPFRFGVTDEAGKINLNALFKEDSSGQIAHDVLLRLPNMTEEIANAILDWIDPDDEPRSGGAENDVYSTMRPPYRCKNGPLESVEELLLVQGVTPMLLLGNDRNRNGILDADEDDGTGALDPGWAAYLTVYSREQNLDAAGQPRIYVNDPDLNGLYNKLLTAVGQDLANYILAYRIYGPATQTSSSSRGGAQLTRSNLDFQRGRPRSLSSLFALVNSEVSIQGSGPRPSTTRYPSPLNNPGTLRQSLPELLDKVSTRSDAELGARVNINTAPRAVLLALPGMTEADAQTILDRRPSLFSEEPPDPIYQTPAWLITEANFQPELVRTLERYITASSRTYRVQVLGHFDGGGPTARVEAVIDTNFGRPRFVYWRDLTELGRGFDLRKIDRAQ